MSGRDWGRDHGGRLGGALFIAEGAVEDKGLGDFVVASFHKLFLHDVLDLFDMDEGLLGGVNAFGDSLGDGDGGRAVAVEGEEGFADGDLDFLRDEGDDLLVAADDAERI